MRQFAEQGERAFGLGRVDLADGMADMHDHIVAQLHAVQQRDGNGLADTAQDDDGLVVR